MNTLLKDLRASVLASRTAARRFTGTDRTPPIRSASGDEIEARRELARARLEERLARTKGGL